MRSANLLKYPYGSGTTPPTPKTGSAQTPAILPLLEACIVYSASFIKVSTVICGFL